MQGTFMLMEGDDLVGTFTIDSEKNVWIYCPGDSLESQPLVFRLQLIDNNVTTLSGDIVRDWITGRAPDPGYAFIDALMERVGIAEYDPLAFLAYNSGRFNTDKFYLVGAGMNPTL